MNYSQNHDNLLSSDALVIANDSVIRQYPGRKIGNITVRPVLHYYIVKMYDLPKLEEEEKKYNGIEVKIDRTVGKIIDLQNINEPSQYSTSYVPDSIIMGRKAFQVALDTLKGFENFDKEGKIIVELVGEIYKITFPLLAEQKDSRGADFFCQVSVNAITAEVVEILAGR
jgi:hypothetical protein